MTDVDPATLAAAADHLLSTTRSVRRRLDLDRPVDREVILDCLRLAVQAPTASNGQDWRWMVVTDRDKRAAIGEYYRNAGADYLSQAAASESDPQTRRVYESAAEFAGILGRVPVMVIPCIERRLGGDPNVVAAAAYGSILPAVWSFALALRLAGTGQLLDHAAPPPRTGGGGAAGHPRRRHPGRPPPRGPHRGDRLPTRSAAADRDRHLVGHVGRPMSGSGRDDGLARSGRRARALGAAIEPFVGQVYFSPECHAAYEQLGFGASPVDVAGVAMPDGPAYFCSRGSLLGQVPGPVVSAAFAVFNPAVVVPCVEMGWALTDAVTIEAARTEGAVGQLRRVLGGEPDGLERAVDLLTVATEPLRPEGRPLYAGVLAQGLPGEPLADAWRLADRLREFRGDAHTAAWTGAGFDACEIGLLTELYWGLPLRTYVRTRAWSDRELDAAEARLRERGLVADGAFTETGRRAREAVERTTDLQCDPAVDALGDDLDELVEILNGWGSAIRAAGGYPSSGPLDLAAAADPPGPLTSQVQPTTPNSGRQTRNMRVQRPEVRVGGWRGVPRRPRSGPCGARARSGRARRRRR